MKAIKANIYMYLATKMLWEFKNQTQYYNIEDFFKELYLDSG